VTAPGHSFVYPTIIALPPGYDCTTQLAHHRIGAYITAPLAEVRALLRRYSEGEVVDEHEASMRFEHGRLVSPPPVPFVWRDSAAGGGLQPSFAEIAINAADDRPIFSSRRSVTGYSIYTKPGKKAFLSDNAYKYGSPPIIALMAELGQFVEGYPVVHLDRERDFGETLTLINPYLRPINVRIVTHDRRGPMKMQVPPQSVRSVPLASLLREDEVQWLGQIQLTANNRLIAFHIRHSLSDPLRITDHEHLDPFRTDPTCRPATQAARAAIGQLLRQARHRMRG
jgi:hypothetical protein